MEPFRTVTSALQYHAERNPDKPAFIFRDKDEGRKILNFGLIYRLGRRWAAVLKAAGLGRGRFLLNTLPNSPERVVCEAGILLAGAASVNGERHLADGSDFLQVLRQTRASAVVLDPDVADGPWNSLREILKLRSDSSVSSQDFPHLQKVFFVRRHENEVSGDFLRHLETLEDSFHADDVASDDICTVFTTSGSTGFSKLVAYDHSYLLGLSNRCRIMQTVPQAPTEFSTSPLGWVGGYAGHVFVTGVTRVLCDVRAGAPKEMGRFILQAVQEEKCNQCHIAPLYLQQMRDIVKDYQAAGDEMRGKERVPWRREGKAVFLGGQPITRSVVDLASSLFEFVAVLYAGTDLGLVSMATMTDPSAYEDLDCGFPVSNVKVRIASRDEESISMPAGENGCILVKHTNFKLQYMNDNAASRAALTPDGFIRTGDIGKLTTDGRLIVEGRGNDAIMRGVIIFYPGWLEARIRECQGVLDVMVVGVPDPVLNEELCACVVLESDSVTMQSIRYFVERDIVTSYDDPLSPRPRHYLKFDSLPLTSTGKPSRKMLQQLAMARLFL